jgi:Replication-relaxation
MTRPVGRPATLSRESGNTRTGAASREFSTPKGRVPRQSLYLTADRFHRISAEMTERDQGLLDFIHESRFATGQQLIRAFWQTEDPDTSSARAGRRALKRLTDWRVLETLPRRIGGIRTGSSGLVYRVGRAGTRLLVARGINGPRVEVPGTLHLTHTLATTELALRLREAHRTDELEVIEVQQEPRCWRGYLGPGASRRVLKPDLFVRVGAGALEDRWMVEVDLASESGRTIACQAGRYIEHYRAGAEQREHRTYPRVLWTVPDEGRAQQIGDVLDRLPAEARRLFTVCRFDDAVPFLAAEASK